MKYIKRVLCIIMCIVTISLSVGTKYFDVNHMEKVEAASEGVVAVGLSAAKADVNNWHNEIDVIDIFLDGNELMTNFEWVEGKTYHLIMPNAASPPATATFDESGNMQITALSDEAKPYEGYYTKIV